MFTGSNYPMFTGYSGDSNSELENYRRWRRVNEYVLYFMLFSIIIRNKRFSPSFIIASLYRRMFGVGLDFTKQSAIIKTEKLMNGTFVRCAVIFIILRKIRHDNHLFNKYFSHLTDEQLNNFDYYINYR